MNKQKGVINSIYQRIGKGGEPSYGNYLGWVSLALAKRFRWFIYVTECMLLILETRYKINFIKIKYNWYLKIYTLYKNEFLNF